MKQFSLFCFLVVCMLKSFSQTNPSLPCDNDFFNTDTSKYFLINEVKPLGSDKFIELWNCRDSLFRADAWYIYGIYSGVVDSIFDTTILAHSFLILPLPGGLWMQDGIRIVTRRYDTVWDISYAMAYTLTDPNLSIGFCDWYRQMTPTPGFSNNCTITSIDEIANLSELRDVTIYNAMGQLLFCGESKLCMTTKAEGVVFVFAKHMDGTMEIFHLCLSP